nr:hypothetical protein [uncultured Halomonas sp.]
MYLLLDTRMMENKLITTFSEIILNGDFDWYPPLRMAIEQLCKMIILADSAEDLQMVDCQFNKCIGFVQALLVVLPPPHTPGTQRYLEDLMVELQRQHGVLFDARLRLAPKGTAGA